MSTLKTTYLQHPSSGSPNLTLAADGSVSGGAGLGGLVHIHTEEFTAVSSVSIDDVFDATYDNYLLFISGTTTGAPGTDMRIRMRSLGSDNSSSTYYGGCSYLNTSTIGFQGGLNGATSGYLGDIRDVQGYAQITRMMRPFESVFTSIIYDSETYDNRFLGYNCHNVAASFDGFTIYPSSGAITGSIAIYGYRKS